MFRILPHVSRILPQKLCFSWDSADPLWRLTGEKNQVKYKEPVKGEDLGL